MTLIVLGGLELEGSSFGRPKPLVLLAYLTLEGARDRRHLAQLFWPRAANPAGSLSKALGQLRQGAGEVFEDGGSALRSLVDTDADHFLAALEEGREREAVDLYRGRFLAGLDLDLEGELEGWVLRRRELLADRQRGALLRLGERAAAAEDFAAAARYAHRAYFLRAAPEPGRRRRSAGQGGAARGGDVRPGAGSRPTGGAGAAGTGGSGAAAGEPLQGARLFP
jgi:DNA-binding SARP family transcriptional activator